MHTGFTHAVDFERFRMIAFATVPVPPALRDCVTGPLGGKVLQDVSLENDEEAMRWPEGADAPDAVLCVSRSQPNRYKVFRHRREVGAEFTPVHKNYTLIASISHWNRFIESLKALDAIAHHTDPAEPPDLMERVMRGIDSHRPPGHRLFEGMH